MSGSATSSNRRVTSTPLWRRWTRSHSMAVIAGPNLASNVPRTAARVPVGGGAAKSAAVSAVNYMAARAVTGAGLLAAAVVVGGPVLTVRSAAAAVALGAANAVSARLYLHANHLALRESADAVARANSVYYLVPVAALAVLASAGAVSVAEPGMLAAGAVVVAAANLAMHRRSWQPGRAGRRGYPQML